MKTGMVPQKVIQSYMIPRKSLFDTFFLIMRGLSWQKSGICDLVLNKALKDSTNL